MSDFILDKQQKSEAKPSTSMTTKVTKAQIIFKPLLVIIALLGFIIMSLKSDNLFLTELLVSGGIIVLISVVHVISQFNTINKR